jgi:hypothetical protein
MKKSLAFFFILSNFFRKLFGEVDSTFFSKTFFVSLSKTIELFSLFFGENLLKTRPFFDLFFGEICLEKFSNFFRTFSRSFGEHFGEHLLQFFDEFLHKIETIWRGSFQDQCLGILESKKLRIITIQSLVYRNQYAANLHLS